MTTILITGGTGVLGRHVLARLGGSGHDLTVLTRKSRPGADGIQYVTGDLSTGAGVESAVAGAEIIVHCAGSPKGDEQKTANLVRAAEKLASTAHLICISVAGADRVPVTGPVDRTVFGYFAMKAATEQVVRESVLPWTILRASQFFDLVQTVASSLAKLPVVLVPAGLRFQPIDSDEVAARMVELALAQPAGLVAEIAGPHVYEMPDLVRGYLQAVGKKRLMVPFPLPGKAARAVRSGAITVSGTAYGKRTWEEFLRQQ